MTLTRTQVQLLPGTNEVTENEWAIMQAHIQAEIKAGMIVAVSKNITAGNGKDAKPGKAKSLKEMPVKTAVQYIADCVNPDSLKKWYETETRDEVRLAVVKRMETLKIEVPKTSLENDDRTSLENDEEKGAGSDESGGEGGAAGGPRK
jgi:hypothetical protein